MSTNLETRENKTKDASLFGRHLLNISGWLILLTAVILAFRPTALSAQPAVENAPSSATTSRPNPHIGPLDAPITIVEFGDFACPACGVWNELGIIERVLEKYGDQVRFVWADFPSVTLDSPWQRRRLDALTIKTNFGSITIICMLTWKRLGVTISRCMQAF